MQHQTSYEAAIAVWYHSISEGMGGVHMRLEGTSIRTSAVLIYSANLAKDWQGWHPAVSFGPQSMQQLFRKAAMEMLLFNSSWDGKVSEGPFLAFQASSFPGLPPAMTLGLSNDHTTYFVSMVPIWVAPNCLREVPRVIYDGLSWDVANPYSDLSTHLPSEHDHEVSPV